MADEDFHDDMDIEGEDVVDDYVLDEVDDLGMDVSAVQASEKVCNDSLLIFLSFFGKYRIITKKMDNHGQKSFRMVMYSKTKP
jgi:hypothetical protein